MSNREQLIKARAQELWELEGKPRGRDKQHWEQASKEIDEAESGAVRDAMPDSEEEGG